MTNEEAIERSWDRFMNEPEPVEIAFGVADGAVLLLLLLVVWNAGEISKLCFQNVALYAKPKRYRLEGNEAVAMMQAAIGLVCIFVPWLLYISTFPLLDGLLVTEELFTKQGDLDFIYVAVFVALLAFLFLWPLLFLLSRFITLWCHAYGRPEQLERLLIVGSSWLLLGGVLYYYSVRDVSPVVARGYCVAIVGAGLLAFLMLPSEYPGAVVFASMLVEIVHLGRPSVRSYFIEVQPFLWLGLLLSLPYACFLIDRAAADSSLVAFRRLGKPPRRRPPPPPPSYKPTKDEDDRR